MQAAREEPKVIQLLIFSYTDLITLEINAFQALEESVARNIIVFHTTN